VLRLLATPIFLFHQVAEKTLELNQWSVARFLDAL
jgi:hypothetical protein